MRRKVKKLGDIPSDLLKKLLKCSSVKPNLGSDPEFFVADKSGKVVASDKFFPGKKKPLKFSREHSKLKLFFDGIQAEMNIPPSTCRESVTHFIRDCLKKADEIVGKDHKLVIKPSTRVRMSVLRDADPEARIFGCEPDFNAYTLGQNTAEMDASKHPYRYAGGHIHIGISSSYAKKGQAEHTLAKTEEGHIRAIKFIDYMTGAILVMMDKGADAKRRRTKYGTAGCFRPTPYGIEYRTPSCWWIKSPAAASLALGMVRLAWNLLISNCDGDIVKSVGYDLDDVRGIIDESDTVVARRFWKALRPHVAVSSKYIHNPLHIKSIRTPNSGYIADGDEWRQSIMKGQMPKVRSGGAPVYALAAFEYMIKHGSKILVTDNIKKEWSFGNQGGFYNVNGFVNGTYQKLSGNSDFMKFQKDFITNIL